MSHMIKSPSDMIQVARLRQIRWRKARIDGKFLAHVAQIKLSFLIGHFEFEVYNIMKFAVLV
jgi:hypothetical protein